MRRQSGDANSVAADITASRDCGEKRSRQFPIKSWPCLQFFVWPQDEISTQRVIGATADNGVTRLKLATGRMSTPVR
ncbi:MAG: hypothetical protein ACI9KK_002869, partial [Ascidiaceihabitans sp.]